MLAFCLRRAPSTEAEDACAETFLVVWRRIDEIPPAPKTVLCLYGIARKLLSNQSRASTDGVVSTSSSPTSGWRLPLTRCMSWCRTPRSGRDGAVRRLKLVDREIVMLDVWEDLSRAEIAEVLGMTRAAVDQRVHRAYQKLSRTRARSLSKCLSS